MEWGVNATSEVLPGANMWYPNIPPYDRFTLPHSHTCRVNPGYHHSSRSISNDVRSFPQFFAVSRSFSNISAVSRIFALIFVVIYFAAPCSFAKFISLCAEFGSNPHPSLQFLAGFRSSSEFSHFAPARAVVHAFLHPAQFCGRNFRRYRLRF